MNKFLVFLRTIAEVNIPIEQKIDIIKKVIEDITKEKQTDEWIENYLMDRIEVLKQNG